MVSTGDPDTRARPALPPPDTRGAACPARVLGCGFRAARLPRVCVLERRDCGGGPHSTCGRAAHPAGIVMYTPIVMYVYPVIHTPQVIVY